jgi:hypothetical protein
VLGWRSKIGRHVVTSSDPRAKRTHVTILPDGSRSTGTGSDAPLPVVAFIGASFTEGWGLSDEETYLWKLQQLYPSLRILNFARGGYATYQSLLVLEQLLAGSDLPDLVVYPLNQIHEKRNVGDPLFLKRISKSNLEGVVRVPYCTLDDDSTLRRHPPERYPAWPLRDRLALVPYLEDVYAELKAGDRALQMREVTKRLVVEMSELSRSKGVPFLVAIIHLDNRAQNEYRPLLEQEGIDYVSCNASPLARDMLIPGDGHPNAAMNTIWADCFERVLADRFKRISDMGAPRL